MTPPARPPGALDPQMPHQLQTHFHQCACARGTGYAVYCLGERLHAFLAPRFLTSVVVIGVLTFGVSVWWV